MALYLVKKKKKKRRSSFPTCHVKGYPRLLRGNDQVSRCPLGDREGPGPHQSSWPSSAWEPQVPFRTGGSPASSGPLISSRVPVDFSIQGAFVLPVALLAAFKIGPFSVGQCLYSRFSRSCPCHGLLQGRGWGVAKSGRATLRCRSYGCSE